MLARSNSSELEFDEEDEGVEFCAVNGKECVMPLELGLALLIKSCAFSDKPNVNGVTPSNINFLIIFYKNFETSY